MTAHLQYCRVGSTFFFCLRSSTASSPQRDFRPKQRAELASKARRTMSIPSPWHRFVSQTGAAATLLALGLFAPPIANAGCSHLVTSENNRTGASSLIGSVMHDLAGPSDSLPLTPPGRPCSGAWCSGQPAVPPVPIAPEDRQVEPWACFVPVQDVGSVDSSLFLAAKGALRPLRGGNDVFHPPRGFLPL
jgi:hypothetical protein